MHALSVCCYADRACAKGCKHASLKARPFLPAQYHNIFALVHELGIPWPFTDWTPSGFWSRQGLITEAPVFSRRPQLPTMLGQFVHTLPLFRCAAAARLVAQHV